MSNRIWSQFAGVMGLVSAVAAAASAVPLPYQVVQAESNLFVRTTVTSTFDVEPDLTNTFPFTEPLSAISNTQPSGFSNLTADVGLPGGFANGANGITFSELVIHSSNLPGPLFGTSAVPLPLALAGQPRPVPDGDRDRHQPDRSRSTSRSCPRSRPVWIPRRGPGPGLADVTISGNLAPNLAISAVPGIIPYPETPFSQAVQLPLSGLFSGIPGGTRVDVGIPSDALQDQNLSLHPIDIAVNQTPGFLVSLDINNADPRGHLVERRVPESVAADPGAEHRAADRTRADRTRAAPLPIALATARSIEPS